MAGWKEETTYHEWNRSLVCGPHEKVLLIFLPSSSTRCGKSPLLFTPDIEAAQSRNSSFRASVADAVIITS